MISWKLTLKISPSFGLSNQPLVECLSVRKKSKPEASGKQIAKDRTLQKKVMLIAMVQKFSSTNGTAGLT